MENWRCYFCTLVLIGMLCELECGRIVKIGSKGNNVDSENHIFVPFPYVPNRNSYDDLNDNGDSISHNDDHNQRDRAQYAFESPTIFQVVRHGKNHTDPTLPISLSCYAHGIPRPEIKWWRDGTPVGSDTFNQTHDELGSTVKKVTIDIVPRADKESEYFKCEAKNIVGVDSRICKVVSPYARYADCSRGVK